MAPVANVTVLAADGHRTGIIISPPTAGYLLVSFGSNSDTNPHIMLPAGAAALTLWVEQYGESLTMDIHVTLAGTGQAHITAVTDT